MGKSEKPLKEKLQELTDFSNRYAEILALDQIDQAEIDNAIEELRSVRMWFHALKYGDAPGFREPVA
jgi:hypothetical protein